MSTSRPYLRPVQRTTISEDMVDQLVSSILRREMKPGEKLPSERDLMEAFSAGRSSVREALRSLALVGLTETRPGEGTFVSEDAWEFVTRPFVWKSLLVREHALELVEARRVVEGELIAMVAKRGHARCAERLTESLSAMEASLDDPERYLDADLEFHTAVAECAGNRLLLQFLAGLRSLLREFIREVLMVPGSASVALEQHKAMLEAVRAGDSADARQAMHNHLDYVGEQLLSALSESADPGNAT